MIQMYALAAIVAVSLATFGTASMSGAQQAGSNEDEAAIRKVIVEMTEGFNNHDGKAAARMYTPRRPICQRPGRYDEWSSRN